MSLSDERILDDVPAARVASPRPRVVVKTDWLRPLIILRSIAAELGVPLTEADEQRICREAVEALTVALFEEVAAKGRHH